MTDAALDDQVLPALSGEGVNGDGRQGAATAGLILQLVRTKYLREARVGIGEQVAAGGAHGPDLYEASLVDVGRRRAEHNAIRILLRRPSRRNGEDIFAE